MNMDNWEVVGESPRVSLKLEEGHFLHWFRGYGYQISGTEEGRGSICSSEYSMHTNAYSLKGIYSESKNVQIMHHTSYLLEVMAKYGVGYKYCSENDTFLEFCTLTAFYPNEATEPEFMSTFKGLLQPITASGEEYYDKLKQDRVSLMLTDEYIGIYNPRQNRILVVYLHNLLDDEAIMDGYKMAPRTYQRLFNALAYASGITDVEIPCYLVLSQYSEDLNGIDIETIPLLSAGYGIESTLDTKGW